MRLSDWLLTWWKSTELDEGLQSLEAELQEALVPVEPCPRFVSGLRQNLMRQVENIDLSAPPQNQALQTGLLVTGGILGSIVVVLAGIRSVVSLLGVAGLLINWVRQNSQEALAPSNLTQ